MVCVFPAAAAAGALVGLTAAADGLADTDAIADGAAEAPVGLAGAAVAGAAVGALAAGVAAGVHAASAPRALVPATVPSKVMNRRRDTLARPATAGLSWNWLTRGTSDGGFGGRTVPNSSTRMTYD